MNAKKATALTTPCGESRWGSCHEGGTFESIIHRIMGSYNHLNVFLVGTWTGGQDCSCGNTQTVVTFAKIFIRSINMLYRALFKSNIKLNFADSINPLKISVCVLTGDRQSRIIVATQPPRLFTMRNLGGFLLPNYNNNHEG